MILPTNLTVECKTNDKSNEHNDNGLQFVKSTDSSSPPHSLLLWLCGMGKHREKCERNESKLILDILTNDTHLTRLLVPIEPHAGMVAAAFNFVTILLSAARTKGGKGCEIFGRVAQKINMTINLPPWSHPMGLATHRRTTPIVTNAWH